MEVRNMEGTVRKSLVVGVLVIVVLIIISLIGLKEASADTTVSVNLDGKHIEFDQPPIIQ